MMFKFSVNADTYVHVNLKEDFIETLLNDPIKILLLTKPRFSKTVKLERYCITNKTLAEFKFETKTVRDIFYEYYKDDPHRLYHELVNTFIEELKEKYFRE